MHTAMYSAPFLPRFLTIRVKSWDSFPIWTPPVLPREQTFHPRILEHYDGKDIVLNEEKGIVMRTKDFSNLSQYEDRI